MMVVMQQGATHEQVEAGIERSPSTARPRARLGSGRAPIMMVVMQQGATHEQVEAVIERLDANTAPRGVVHQQQGQKPDSAPGGRQS